MLPGSAIVGTEGIGRTGRLVAFVGAATGIALVIAVGAVWGSRDETVPERPEKLPGLPESTSATEVWPEASSTVPARRTDGTSLMPVAALGKNEVLMMTHEHRPTFLTLPGPTICGIASPAGLSGAWGRIGSGRGRSRGQPY
jgi:hypothetical protein